MSLQQLKSQHPHDLFEVTGDTDEKTLKRKFYRLLRQYPNETHPEEFMYLQETYDALVEELARGGFDETPSYETYEYEEIEEQHTRTRTRPLEQWAQYVEDLIEEGAYETALIEARQMRRTYPTESLSFHAYLTALTESGPINATYDEEVVELFQSILYQPHQLSSEYLFALLYYIDISQVLPGGEQGRQIVLRQLRHMPVTEHEVDGVYDFLSHVDRTSSTNVPEAVRLAYREVTEIFGPHDARFQALGRSFVPDAEEEVYREETYEDRYEEERYDTYEVETSSDDEYSFIGMVVFAFILSAMFTPVVGIIAGIYIHIKRIPIWLYIFGLAIWGVIGIVTLMVLGAIVGFIFG